MKDPLLEISEKYKDRKIVIAWPSHELIDYRFAHSLIELVVQNASLFSLGLANSISSRVAVNRNGCVEKARQLEATDILWIDADTKFPVNGLLRLIMHNKDIVGATTRRRDNRGFPVGLTVDPQATGKMVEMKLIGFPFMLTKMSVFDKLEKPYFAEPPRHMLPEMNCADDELVGEDEYFCHYARKAGFSIWCDAELSMEIGHVGSDVKYIEQQYSAPLPPAQPLDATL